MFYKKLRLIEASFMQDVAGQGTSTQNSTQQQAPQTLGQVPQTNAPQAMNTAGILNILKQKGIDVSNPIVAQVANKLSPAQASIVFSQLVGSLNDIKQLPEVLTTLLTLSTQIKNFSQVGTILNTLSKADTIAQS